MNSLGPSKQVMEKVTFFTSKEILTIWFYKRSKHAYIQEAATEPQNSARLIKMFLLLKTNDFLHEQTSTVSVCHHCNLYMKETTHLTNKKSCLPFLLKIPRAATYALAVIGVAEVEPPPKRLSSKHFKVLHTTHHWVATLDWCMKHHGQNICN